MADLLSLLQSKTNISLILLMLVLVLPFSNLAGGDQTTCINPPAGNPNLCHVYIWKNFPVDTNISPPTGLFNNDTSYDFSLNITGITEFQICANILQSPLVDPNSNSTLILQYEAPGGLWTNVDTSPSQSGGALVITSSHPAEPFCSQSIGQISPSLILDNCISAAQICNFRIAGNEGLCSVCVGLVNNDALAFSNIRVQFYMNSIILNGNIACTAVTINLANFVNQCATNVAPTSTFNIGIKWEADNRSGTGSGCGVSSICQKTGVMTCVMNIGTTFCQNAGVSYGQTFTGTVRVSESWSIIRTTGLPSPLYTVTVIS